MEAAGATPWLRGVPKVERPTERVNQLDKGKAQLWKDGGNGTQYYAIAYPTGYKKGRYVIVEWGSRYITQNLDAPKHSI